MRAAVTSAAGRPLGNTALLVRSPTPPGAFRACAYACVCACVCKRERLVHGSGSGYGSGSGPGAGKARAPGRRAVTALPPASMGLRDGDGAGGAPRGGAPPRTPPCKAGTGSPLWPRPVLTCANSREETVVAFWWVFGKRQRFLPFWLGGRRAEGGARGGGRRGEFPEARGPEPEERRGTEGSGGFPSSPSLGHGVPRARPSQLGVADSPRRAGSSAQRPPLPVHPRPGRRSGGLRGSAVG